MSEWFIMENGERSGPYSREELSSGIRQGAVSPEQLVWSTGMEDWVPAREVKELRPGDTPPFAASPPGGETPLAGEHPGRGLSSPSPGTVPMSQQTVQTGARDSSGQETLPGQKEVAKDKKGHRKKVAIISIAVVLVTGLLLFVLAIFLLLSSLGNAPFTVFPRLFGGSRSPAPPGDPADSALTSGEAGAWAVPLDFEGTVHAGEIRDALSESLQRDLPPPGEVPYRAYPGSFFAGRVSAGLDDGRVRQEITLVSLDSSSPVVSFYADELADWALAMEIESFILWADSEGTMDDAYRGLIPAVMIYPAHEWDQEYWHPEAETIIILTY